MELNELHSPGGKSSCIWNTTRGTVNIGPTFTVVHKLCVRVCVGDGGRKGKNQDSYLDVLLSRQRVAVP